MICKLCTIHAQTEGKKKGNAMILMEQSENGSMESKDKMKILLSIDYENIDVPETTKSTGIAKVFFARVEKYFPELTAFMRERYGVETNEGLIGIYMGNTLWDRDTDENGNYKNASHPHHLWEGWTRGLLSNYKFFRKKELGVDDYHLYSCGTMGGGDYEGYGVYKFFEGTKSYIAIMKDNVTDDGFSDKRKRNVFRLSVDDSRYGANPLHIDISENELPRFSKEINEFIKSDQEIRTIPYLDSYRYDGKRQFVELTMRKLQNQQGVFITIDNHIDKNPSNLYIKNSDFKEITTDLNNPNIFQEHDKIKKTLSSLMGEMEKLFPKQTGIVP